MLAVVRLLEPHVYKVAKAEVKQLWNTIRCRKNPPKKKKVGGESLSLCSFMNSAMNREFVYLILMGINNLMNYDQ